jgi:hypothetical protein
MSTFFIEMFNNTSKIDFNSQWKNSTGYLDYICKDDELPEGIHSFVDDYRRKAIVGKKGNEVFVVFERYSNEDGYHVSNESGVFKTRMRDGNPERAYPFSSLLNNKVDSYFDVDHNTYLDWALDELSKMA